MAQDCERHVPLRGAVEADEAYLGGRRKGRRGQSAAEKVAVFGLLKRRGRVYTCSVPNMTQATLLAIIQQMVP